MNFSVALQKQNWSFNVNEGQSVLEAALISGIILPNACRNGTCRRCICPMLKGRVIYKIDWPGLSPDEKADGLILTCVALPQDDLVLDVLHASRIAELGVD